MTERTEGGESVFRNTKVDPRELFIAVHTIDGLVSPDVDAPELFVRPLRERETLSPEALANGYALGHVSFDVSPNRALHPHEAYPHTVGQAVHLHSKPREGAGFRIFDAHAIDDHVDALSAHLKAVERGNDEVVLRDLRLRTHFLHQASNLIRYNRLESPSEVRRTL